MMPLFILAESSDLLDLISMTTKLSHLLIQNAEVWWAASTEGRPV